MENREKLLKLYAMATQKESINEARVAKKKLLLHFAKNYNIFGWGKILNFFQQTDLREYSFPFKNRDEYKILIQIMYTYSISADSVDFYKSKFPNSKSSAYKGKYVLKLQPSIYLQLKEDFDFYLSIFEEKRKTLFLAIYYKYNVFPEKQQDSEPPSENEAKIDFEEIANFMSKMPNKLTLLQDENF